LKVSVITISYNSAETIEETIISVINQDYGNIEYNIIDGGSKDNTLEIINKYKSSISNIISEKDNGIYDAMNKGVKISTGDIIGILNSDDIYKDMNVISDIVSNIKEKDAIYADLVYVDRLNINKVNRYWRSGKYKKSAFLYGWMPPHPTFFVKRNCYKKYGLYNTTLKSASDYELMLRFIHIHKISITYLPRVITKMRTGGVSNITFVNRYKANREDKIAWQINNLKPYFFTFILKPLRKLKQYYL